MVNFVKFAVLGALCIVAANAGCAAPTDCDVCSATTAAATCLPCADKNGVFKKCIDADSTADTTDKKDAACATAVGDNGKFFTGTCPVVEDPCPAHNGNCADCKNLSDKCQLCAETKDNVTTFKACVKKDGTCTAPAAKATECPAAPAPNPEGGNAALTSVGLAASVGVALAALN